MASNNLIMKIIVALTLLFICCSSKAQGYKILVLNPNDLENKYIWDQKRADPVEENAPQSSSKPSEDDPCSLGAFCLPDDNTIKIKDYPDMKNDDLMKPVKKLDGLRIKYDHNIPKILYWPIYEEKL